MNEGLGCMCVTNMLNSISEGGRGRSWERGALLKMGVGPPEPAVRSGLQTTASCWGKESWW